MLRALVLVLVLANGLFFAWTRGGLAPALPAPAHGDREPERLAAQVRPERVTVMTPKAANVALAAASAASANARRFCLEAGPFNDAEIGPAQAALAEAGLPDGSWQREQVERAGRWAVYFGRFSDVAAMRAKQEELGRLKLPLEPAQAPPELVPGLMMPVLNSREAADAALAAMVLRGVRTARVVALPPPPLQHWLRLAETDLDTQARLAALKSPVLAAAPGGGFIACAKAP